LAAKRKQDVAGDGDEDGMDIDENEESEALVRVKRARWEVLPSVTETLRAAVKQTANEE
jgi:hypothetical protein